MTNDATLPGVLPVFPLTGALLMPGNSLPLNIFEPRYMTMVEDARRGAKLIGMIQPRGEETGMPPLFEVGCVGYIDRFSKTQDGRYLITLKGVQRFRIQEELSVMTPYRQAKVDYTEFTRDQADGQPLDPDHKERLLSGLACVLEAKGLAADFDAIRDTDDRLLVNTLAMVVPFTPIEKQGLLEAETTEKRGEMLISLFEMLSRSDTVLANDNAPRGPIGPSSPTPTVN